MDLARISLLLVTLAAALVTAPSASADEAKTRPPPAAEAKPPLPPAGVVDGATAHRLVADGIKVVDVRSPGEFAAGHVPGAVNIPHDEIDRRRAELGPASTPLLLYCHSGRRSGLAISALHARGYDRLYDLQAYDRWGESEPGR
jgi:rhodanese-related sulfurtransferase